MTDEKQIAVLRARPERRRLSLSFDHASRRAAPWPSLQLSSITRFTTALAARAALSGRALRQGVEVWNGWRSGDRKEVADLHGADLRGAKLRGANLSGANLRGARLGGATLHEATLSSANLHEADLRGADLRGADLFGADLRGADLYQARLDGANLSEASLSWATLYDATLCEADLSEATLSWANLYGADLRGADLRGANLYGADLFGARLDGVILRAARLSSATLSGATLSGADLQGADLRGAKLRGAKLRGANLSGADLRGAHLGGGDLSEASLRGANLVNADLADADLTACYVHGISAWDLNLTGVKQTNLIITREDQPEITVDNLEVAQFIYLLLKNERVRHVVDTITSKVVLILGRFTSDRKAVLDAMREELRRRDYLPVLLDHDKPVSKDLTRTVHTLANMARFVIADLTEPSSVSHELAILVPSTVVAVQPVLLKGQHEYTTYIDLKRRHHWVLEPYRYTSLDNLLANLGKQVIAPAEAKAYELRVGRALRLAAPEAHQVLASSQQTSKARSG